VLWRFLYACCGKAFPGIVAVIYTVLYPETRKIICGLNHIFQLLSKTLLTVFVNSLPEKESLKPALQ